MNPRPLGPRNVAQALAETRPMAMLMSELPLRTAVDRRIGFTKPQFLTASMIEPHFLHRSRCGPIGRLNTSRWMISEIGKLPSRRSE